MEFSSITETLKTIRSKKISVEELSKIFINDSEGGFEQYLSRILFLFIDFGEHILLSSSKREISEGEHLFIAINYPDIYNNLSTNIVIENIITNELGAHKN